MSAAVETDREPWRRLAFGSLFALAFLLGCFPMSDFDVWWHLRTGQLILEQGLIPRTDFLTYTNAGRPWIDLYWLFQVMIAGLHRLGGSSALVLLKATVGTAIVALAVLTRRAGSKAAPALLAWLPAVVLLTGRLCERPELFSLLFVACFLAILGRASDRPRWLLALPVLQALWVNCHGFFLLGPFIFFAYVVGQIYDHVRPPSLPTAHPPWKTLAMVAVLTLLACVLSPYGAGAVRLPLEQFHKLGSTGIYRTNISELRTIGDFIAAAGLGNPYLLAYFIVVLLGIASFVIASRTSRLHPFRALVFLAAVYLGWQATRNSALCAVIAAFVTTWNLDDAFKKAEPVPATSRRGKPAQQPRKRTLPANYNPLLLAGIGALAVATLSGKLYAWAGEGRTMGLGERPQWYAHDACAFLARPDLPERIVAFNISQAAVCIAHASPSHKLFMDPRLEVNSQETFERYLDGIRKLWRGQPGWETPLGIDYQRADEMPAILVERGVLARAADVLAQDPRWRCVHADSVAVAFVPTAFAEAHGLAEVPR